MYMTFFKSFRFFISSIQLNDSIKKADNFKALYAQKTNIVSYNAVNCSFFLKKLFTF